MKLFIPFITGNRKQTVLHQPMTIKNYELAETETKKHRLKQAVKTYTGFDTVRNTDESGNPDGDGHYYYERKTSISSNIKCRNRH